MLRPRYPFLALLALLALTGCGGLGRYFAARGRDIVDCFKANVGAGIGICVDARVTDFMAPGVGFASYTVNAGWDDRRVYGAWTESDVINTPRMAWEAVGRQFEPEAESEEGNEMFVVSRLALSSVFLPNERWIRSDDDLTVEYYSLFNFGGLTHRATILTGHLQRTGERPKIPDKDIWQRGFLEVGATAGVVHARAGFNPLQLFDFVVGWFGWDPAGDDRDPEIDLVDAQSGS